MIGGGPFRLFVAPGNALLAAAGARRGVGVGLGGRPPPMSNMVSCCQSVAVGEAVASFSSCCMHRLIASCSACSFRQMSTPSCMWSVSMSHTACRKPVQLVCPVPIFSLSSFGNPFLTWPIYVFVPSSLAPRTIVAILSAHTMWE